jgi:hypothetical protein
MQILQNVIQQLQLQNQMLLAQYISKCQCNVLQVSVNPINRGTVDLVYNLINSPQFKQQRQNVPNKNDINVIIDSNGGDADAAYHIAKMIDQNFSGTIKYIIPRFAKSAATLMVCGGDKIIMGETSELGPLDPQIQQPDGSYISAKSVASTLDLIKTYLVGGKKEGLELATILSSRLNPLVLGQYESTMTVAQEYQKELLKLRMYKPDVAGNDAKVETIARKFATGYTHHSRVITCKEAQDIFGADKVEIMPQTHEQWTILWQMYQNNKSIADIAGILPIVNNRVNK